MHLPKPSLRRVPKPSPALLIGLLALVVASTGTAVAATGTVVNIADGTTAANVAKVNANGQLHVSDGSGAMTVDGKAAEAVPAVPFTAVVEVTSIIGGPSSCTSPTFTLPTGVPILIKRVVADFNGASPSDNPSAALRLYRKTGSSVVPVDYAIPLGLGSFAYAGGSVDLDLTVRGNTISAANGGEIYQVEACLNRGSAPGPTGATVMIHGLR